MREEQLKAMPYKRLYNLVKSKEDGHLMAAQEIRDRRRSGELPEITAFKTYHLSTNQQRTQDKLIEALTGDKDTLQTDTIKIYHVAYSVRGGWVVYLTGDDADLINSKIAKTVSMVLKDAEEFGQCRVCVAAVGGQGWDGIRIRFDRGLRLVF